MVPLKEIKTIYVLNSIIIIIVIIIIIIIVLWNEGVQTDREVLANGPYIIIRNKKDRIFTLIDLSVPSDRTVTRKYEEKKLKYKNVCIEI
jgi:hypothetical protein